MSAWRKSRHSGTGGNDCVEIAAIGQRRGVRDSKHPGNPHLNLSVSDFRTLLNTIKDGAYDR